MVPAVIATAPRTYADATAEPRPVSRPQQLRQFYEALDMPGGRATRIREGSFVEFMGYIVATGFGRVRLPADTTFALFGYAVDMLLARLPRAQALRVQRHEGHIDLEPVEMCASPRMARATARMLDRLAGRDPGPRAGECGTPVGTERPASGEHGRSAVCPNRTRPAQSPPVPDQ
jgi:hypothetical protein